MLRKYNKVERISEDMLEEKLVNSFISSDSRYELAVRKAETVETVEHYLCDDNVIVCKLTVEFSNWGYKNVSYGITFLNKNNNLKSKINDYRELTYLKAKKKQIQHLLDKHFEEGEVI